MRCQVVEEFMSMADGQTVAVKGPHPAMSTQAPSKESAAAGLENAALATAAAAAAKVCNIVCLFTFKIPKMICQALCG